MGIFEGDTFIAVCHVRNGSKLNDNDQIVSIETVEAKQISICMHIHGGLLPKHE